MTGQDQDDLTLALLILSWVGFGAYLYISNVVVCVN